MVALSQIEGEKVYMETESRDALLPPAAAEGFARLAPLIATPYAREVYKVCCACLDALGVPRHLLGYRYCIAIVVMAMESSCSCRPVAVGQLFRRVAEYFQACPAMVDRAVGHAFDRAWFRGDAEACRYYFFYNRNEQYGQPTNAEFLNVLVERVRALMPPSDAK